MANTTNREHIINYTKNKNYFHLNDLIEYFNKKNIKFKKNSIKQYLYILRKEKFIYESGRGWYSTIKEEFKLNIIPIKTITMLAQNKFPFLVFSCWSTEQLKGFFHHLPSQFITFIYADKDFLQSVKDFLAENDYNVYLNPYKIEAEKFVELKTKTIILRPSISFRIPKEKNWAKIEKILVDLFMETKKIGLIDEEEYRRIFSNIILSYRINMAEMFDYAHNRKIKNKMQDIIIKYIKLTNATF